MCEATELAGKDPPSTSRCRAWIVVLCSYTAIFSHSTVLFGQGVLFLQLLDKFGEGEANTAMVGSVNSAIFCFSALLASIFINVTNCRVVIITGSIVHVTGLVLSAFVPNLALMTLTMGALAAYMLNILVGSCLRYLSKLHPFSVSLVITNFAFGLSAVCLLFYAIRGNNYKCLGNSLVNGGSTCVVGYYFPRHSDTFVSLSFVMMGVALCAAGPVMVLLTEHFSYEEICMILASVNIHGCVWGALCRPSVYEKEIKTKRHKERHTKSFQDDKRLQQLKSCFDFSLLLNISFTSYMISLTTWNFSFMMAVVHFPNFIVKLGGSDKDISLIMLSFAIANACGRAVGTVVVNTLNKHLLFVQNASLGISGLLTASFSLYGYLPGAPYFFAIQLGLFIGIPNTMMTPLCNQFVGMSKTAESYGFVYVFCGIGIATGPIVAGVLFSTTGSYLSSFVTAGCILVFGCLLGFLAHFLRGDNSHDLKTFELKVVEKNGELLIENCDINKDCCKEETAFMPLTKSCNDSVQLNT